MLRIRIGEGDQPEIDLLWDSQWHPPEGIADWILSDGSEPNNKGGLRAKATLHTAVTLLLFTDKRIPDDHPLRYLVEDGDTRGWWGDAIDVRADLNETEMGSLLWIFARAPLTAEIVRWVEQSIRDALAPLIAQKVAVRIDVQMFPEFALDRLDAAVQIYGRDGTLIFDQRFASIWRQSISSPAAAEFPVYINPSFIPSMDFRDRRNSQYIPLI